MLFFPSALFSHELIYTCAFFPVRFFPVIFFSALFSGHPWSHRQQEYPALVFIQGPGYRIMKDLFLFMPNRIEKYLYFFYSLATRLIHVFICAQHVFIYVQQENEKSLGTYTCPPGILSIASIQLSTGLRSNFICSFMNRSTKYFLPLWNGFVNYLNAFI